MLNQEEKQSSLNNAPGDASVPRSVNESAGEQPKAKEGDGSGLTGRLGSDKQESPAPAQSSGGGGKDKEEIKGKNLVDPNFKRFNTDKIKNTIVPLIFFIASVLIGVFLIYPAYQETGEINAEIESARVEVEMLANKAESLQRFSAVQNALRDNSEVLIKAIPEEAGIPEFMTLVQDISQTSGVELSALSFGGGSPRATESDIAAGSAVLTPINIQGGARGSFSSVRSFLKNLEDSLRMMKVESLRLTSTRDDVVEANFAVVGYAAQVTAEVRTEDPLDFNLTEGNFTDVLNFLRTQRGYDIDVPDTGVGRPDPFRQ